ncbi:MAG: PepSY domain-containing protein [Gammaproteobacteria bacterium]|uniref:PepSY domain-containing protein n=1 Tax=Thalassobaculum sp. TaxID=2022740 RepID=UPI0032EC7B30
MFRSKILPATMAAVIVLGASGAAFAATGENEDSQEIAAVLGAKTSIAQAIAAAERQTGGRAVKIDFEKEKGAYLYEVKTVSKDKVAEVFVDPASGQVVRTDDEGLISKIFDREDQDEFSKPAASSTTLAAAIATAEQHTGGKAIEASFDNEDGAMLFEVEVTRDNAMHKVVIDSANGKVLKVATAEDGEHDKD